MFTNLANSDPTLNDGGWLLTMDGFILFLLWLRLVDALAIGGYQPCLLTMVIGHSYEWRFGGDESCFPHQKNLPTCGYNWGWRMHISMCPTKLICSTSWMLLGKIVVLLLVRQHSWRDGMAACGWCFSSHYCRHHRHYNHCRHRHYRHHHQGHQDHMAASRSLARRQEGSQHRGSIRLSQYQKYSESLLVDG